MTDSPTDLNGAKILLVDDQPANLDVLNRLLERQGFEISVAINGPMALEVAPRLVPDLILLDVVMPHMDGFEVCRQLKAHPPTQPIPVVFISATDRSEGLLAGFEAGGIDYITKPFEEREVLIRVQTHIRLNLTTRALLQKNQALKEEIAQRDGLKTQINSHTQSQFVGDSPALRGVQTALAQVAPTQETVLILGETGTGKGVAARCLHDLSPRQGGPFIQVNCGAIPRDLVESELFGHEKGAFTGATNQKLGKVELAKGGTLFLDEIGDMSLEAQVKLLRLLGERTFERVGGTETLATQVRVVAATNRDLRQMVRAATFREDLYFRLHVFEVELPALRQRREDIPLLASFFATRMGSHLGKDLQDLSPVVEQALAGHAWPGNVRELEHVVRRAVIVCPGEQIRVEDLALEPAPHPLDTASDWIDLEEHERRYIRRVLDYTNGVIRGPYAAAAILGLNPSTLYGRMKKLGIERA